MRPDDYEYMCPADLAAVSDGYNGRVRMEWERTLLLLNAWLTKPMTYDDLFGGPKTSNEIKSKEDWEKFKQKFAGR